jgi:hypothetical protein
MSKSLVVVRHVIRAALQARHPRKEKTMKYAILQYLDEKKLAAPTPEEMKEAKAAYQAYAQALNEAGAFVNAIGLQGSATATTVRVTNGERSVQDGPYADTKEQFAGIFIIEAPDLDAALEWAARHPAAVMGAVEVRPLWGQG